jgi:hypothetical protein
MATRPGPDRPRGASATERRSRCRCGAPPTMARCSSSVSVDADASPVEETTKVQALLARKYPWAWPAYRALMVVSAAIRRLRRQAPSPWLTIRITPRQGVAVSGAHRLGRGSSSTVSPRSGGGAP